MKYRDFIKKIFYTRSKVAPRQKWWAMLFLMEYKKRFKRYKGLRIKIEKSQLVFLVGSPEIRELHIRELDPNSEGVEVTFLVNTNSGQPKFEQEIFSENPKRMSELWDHIKICIPYGLEPVY